MIDNSAEITRVLQQAQEIQRRSEATRAKLAELEGVGGSADGLVRVAVGPGGGLKDVRIDGRAMRMQSHDLAAAIMEAGRAAAEELQRSSEEMMSELIDEDLRAVLDGKMSPTEYATKVSSTAARQLDDAAYEMDRIRRQAGG